MKTYSLYIKKLMLPVILLLAVAGNVFGQDDTPYDPVTGKEIISEDVKQRALVAPDCMVSIMWEAVSVIGGNKEMNKFLDADLTNSVRFQHTVEADLVETEIIRVKDRKHVYKKGTPVGFCLDIGKAVLDLELVGIYNILYYYNGEYVGSGTASSGGEGGSLLDLDLIQLPGESATTLVMAKEPNVFNGDYFDEIALAVGGVGLSVLSEMSIRYAFAGNPQETTLTTDNESVLGDVSIVDDIWTIGDTYNVFNQDNFIDSPENDNHAYSSVILETLGGSAITIKWEKSYPAGTEVGLYYGLNTVLSANLGEIGRIVLYDGNGNETDRVPLDASVLSLNLLGSSKYKASIVASKPFSQAKFQFEGLLNLDGGIHVDLGNTNYYYGFIREQPIVSSECHIDDLGMNASVCGSETEYQLSPAEGVTWTLEKVTEDPEGYKIMEPESEQEKSNVTIEDGKVTGISPNVEGYYHFKAISDSGCKDWLVLRHGVQASASSCNTPITDDEYEIAPARNAEGGIVILNSIKNRENVIDDNPDNYAEMTPGIKLLSSDYIVGVSKKDGVISDGGEVKRIGFIADIPTNVLTLNALQFFHIKLYKEGKPVEGKESYVVDDWNVISAGLIGSEGASRSRLGVTIPAGVSFDEFSLWSSGVASVNLSALRVYSAFVENESDMCDNPLMGCEDAVIVGAGALEDASINYDRTGFPALLNAGVVLSGLDNLLSGEKEIDPDKYAYGYVTASAAGSMQVSIKFGRTLTANHQVGFVVDEETFLLGADVIGVTQIKSYYSKGPKPDEPVETKSDWSVLGADVIGYGDYAYLMFNPTQTFDEIQLVTAAGVNLAKSTKIYAVFVRTDADGDGIPDCMDPTPCEGGSLSSVNLTTGVCEDDNITLSGLANFGDDEPRIYTIKYQLKGGTGEAVTVTDNFTIKNGMFEYSFTIPKAGIYTITLVSGESTAEEDKHEYSLTVHPKETTWEGDAASGSKTDWNEWGNWSDGAPWTCTNVIIPTNGDKNQPIENYPILTKDVQNPCNYIHFEPHAEVVNTPYLTYQKAWVEIALQPDRYYMVSAPLKNIFSGDWFYPRVTMDASTSAADAQTAINKVMEQTPYFTALTEEKMPANRVTPIIYQRVWERTVVNKLASGGQTGVYPTYESTRWTAPYNWLSTSYEKQEETNYASNALSVWVHPFSATDADEKEPAPTDNIFYTFRFPKEHTTYFYTNEKGEPLSYFVDLKREHVGRFIYEDEESNASFPITMVYKNEGNDADNKFFLVGNPFMSHINVEKFFEGNKQHIQSIKVYDGTGNNSIIKLDGEGILSATKENTSAISSIAPMQSFFVVTNDASAVCEITYTEDMLEQKPGAGGYLKSAQAATDEDRIYLTAMAAGKESSAVLRFSASASDYFRSGEDADILIDDEVPPAVAVFTVAGERAVDIQQRVNGGEIPLGFFLAKPEEVTLRLTVPRAYEGWSLNDAETGKSYPLRAGTNEFPLGRMLTNEGRFSLHGDSPTGNETITASQPRVYCFREEGNMLVVRSEAGMMARCEVYAPSGQLSGMARYETNEYRLPVAPGAKIVRVYFTDGVTSTIKTF